MLVIGERSYFHAGLLALGMNDSLEAELHGIAHALTWFLGQGVIPPGARVQVHNDNTTAVAYLNAEAWPKSDRHQLIAATEQVEHLVREYGLTLGAKWVKSHQGFEAKCWRGLLNSRVDREARRIAREHGRKLEKAAQEANAE